MLRCHQCGETLREAGVQRVTRTGKYPDGSSYYRTVNLCWRCDEERTGAERSATVKKAVLLLTAVAALIGGGVYFWFFRSG